MKKLLTFFVFLLLFVGFFHEIQAITQDLGRHLIMGKIITQSLSIPKTNLFSYTYPNHPFINHHWLSEVLFYNIFQFAGFSGLLLFSTLVILLSFLLLFLSVKKHAHIFAIAAASLLYFSILFERTDLRPEIFSFLFLSLFIVILYRFNERFTKWIFILPLLELFWVNMHIYFIIGIVVIGLFLVDHFLRHPGLSRISLRFWMRSAYQNDEFAKNSYILVLILFLSLIAIFCNPNGINGALYPFHLFQNYGYAIEENQTIFFLWNYSQKPTIAFFILTAILLFVFLLITLKKTRPIDWLFSITFTVLAAIAIRNFPLFVFATFIPFCASINIIMKKFSQLLARDVSQSRFLLLKQTALLILFLVLLGQMYTTATTKHVGASVSTGAKNAADFFIENNMQGPIFNNFDIGSYLDYRFYPKERVFVDGRPEAYPASFFQKEYIPMQQDAALFEQKVKKYTINSIFFAHTDQTPWAESFLRQIVSSPQWNIVYVDDYAIILLKNNQQNQSLIQKFAMQKDSLQVSNYEARNFESLLQLAHFFSIIHPKNQELQIYQDILKLKPDYCPALYNAAVSLTKEQPAVSAFYKSQFFLRCQ